MRIDIISLFPSVFEGLISESMIKIAREKNLVEIRVTNLRDFSKDKHRKVDEPPYGGGPGMVLTPQPVFDAVAHLRAEGRESSRLILLTPQGIPYSQAMARELAREKGLILLCGHYEGFDERIREGLKPLEISIGDYILTGGEVPSMVLMDSVIRLLPGVLGDERSTEEESFSQGLLEYPHYTKPREFMGMKVPDVLVSGDHAKIRAWRQEEAMKRTSQRRPDLLGDPPRESPRRTRKPRPKKA